MLEPVGGEGDVIILGLRVAGIVVDLVDRRDEQPAGLGQHVEIAGGAVDERPGRGIRPGRRIDDDDRPPLRLEPERRDPGERREAVGPGAGGIDQHRRGQGLAGLGADRPSLAARSPATRRPVSTSPPPARTARAKDWSRASASSLRPVGSSSAAHRRVRAGAQHRAERGASARASTTPIASVKRAISLRSASSARKLRLGRRNRAWHRRAIAVSQKPSGGARRRGGSRR